MKKTTAFIIVGALLCIAAASASYRLRPAVVDHGGAVASSSSYEMRASVGGPVIAGAAEPGTASSTNYRFEAHTMTVLETGAKEEPPADGNGGRGGGGCSSGAGAALVLVLALAWKARRK